MNKQRHLIPLYMGASTLFITYESDRYRLVYVYSSDFKSVAVLSLKKRKYQVKLKLYDRVPTMTERHYLLRNPRYLPCQMPPDDFIGAFYVMATRYDDDRDEHCNAGIGKGNAIYDLFKELYDKGGIS